jgi:hypothetical protein
VTNRVLAVALTADERNLLASTLVLAEELGADRTLTRPLAEMLTGAVRIDDRAVREALTAQSFFAESRVVA